MTARDGMSLNALLAALGGARIYDLEQPRYSGAPTAAPHAPGFAYALHRRHEHRADRGRTSAAGLLITSEHFGTHIDALSHQAEDMHLFGGKAINSEVQTSAGFTHLGAETIPPLLCRGILLDVAGFHGVERLDERRQISALELQEVADLQKTSIASGDVVLVRTGNGAAWHTPELYLQGAGMAPSASRWLAELGVRAVGADNVAWDVPDIMDSEMGMLLPGHAILMVRNGIYIIEHLYLEELARDRVHEFVLVCLPLKLHGSTASPVRPIAVST